MSKNQYTGEELRRLSDADLIARLKEDEASFIKMKFNHSVSMIEDPNNIKLRKKDIARLKTELRARQLANKK